MRLHEEDTTALVVHRVRRILWLQGAINKDAGRFVKKCLNAMNRISTKEPIWFYLWSGGGDALGEGSIIRAVDSSPAPVMMIGCRIVASAALVVFQSGFKHYALAGTKFAFHQARAFLSDCPKGGLMIGSDQCLHVFNALKRADAFSLRELSRHIRADKAGGLLSREATISVAHAIRLGMVDGYFDVKEFKRDQRIIAALYNRARRGRPR